MGYSLKDFCRDTTEILKTGASRQHVDKVKAQMERLLVDSAFVKEYFGDNQPLGLKRIHIDAATGKVQRIFGRQAGAPAAIAR